MRRSAVEKVFPCASVISDSVPPPPRLSCRRKLSAPRLGNSKRSTSPLQIPRKCSLTRDAVTSRTSSGYHSSRKAINPTLAVSPLSPERACASVLSRTFNPSLCPLWLHLRLDDLNLRGDFALRNRSEERRVG